MRGLDPQFWARIYSLDITSDECLYEVRALLNCPSRVTAARNLQGGEAQIFVDFLDKVSDRSTLSPDGRRR